MEPVILDSARKWGITDEDILHAFRNPFRTTQHDEGFTMIFGAARNGVTLIEVGYVTADSGDLLIVHAMETTDKRLR